MEILYRHVSIELVYWEHVARKASVAHGLLAEVCGIMWH